MELSGVLKFERTARKRSARLGVLHRSSLPTKLGLAVCFLCMSCAMLGCQAFSDKMPRWGSSSLDQPAEASAEAELAGNEPEKTEPPKNEPGVATISDAPSSEGTASEENASEEPTSKTPSSTSSTASSTTEKPASDQAAEEKPESAFRIGDVKTILAKSGGWIGTPEPMRKANEAKGEVSWNWYHPGIEDILAWSEENEPILRETLKQGQPVAATNAAICLARMKDSSGVSVLLGAVRSPRLDMANRAAAAEALASLDSSAKTIQKLIDEFRDQGKTPNPDLYQELIAGLARHIDPAGDRRFLDALKSRSPDVRLAAIEAWSKSQCEVLPDELVYLVADQSDKNRSAVIRALGSHDHAQRMHYLSSGLRDVNYLVRVAAVESLGQIGSKEAIDWLKEASESTSPLVRAAAVRALTDAGQNEMALKSVKDEAWQVRLAVAESLSAEKTPTVASREVAKALLFDRSQQVQSQTLASIDGWPLAESGPLLLDAIEKLGYQGRQEAITQLAKHWEPAKRFPRQAPEEVRKRSLVQLRSEFQEAFGRASTGVNGFAKSTEDADYAEIDPALITHAKRLIARHEDPRCASADRYQIRQALHNLGSDPIKVLEYLVFEERQELPEDFYTTLLPNLDPTFDILYQMQDSVTTSARLQARKKMSRRRAASDLIRLTAEHEPSRLALDRLAQQMLQETDTLIWRSVMTAFADNGNESVLQMVHVAIGHESAEIRLRACQWLASHPDPGNFKLLRPALEDTNQKVKVAAIRAIVACGSLDDAGSLKKMLADDPTPEEAGKLFSQLQAVTPPQAEDNWAKEKTFGKNADTFLPDLREVDSLKKLLGDSNEELRIEVAYALAAFGDEDGPQALKRLAQSRDASVRQKVAEAMGRLEDPRYISFLVTLLDDQVNVRRAALEALPKVTGHEAPVAGARQPRTPTEKISRWKEWHAHRLGSSLR